MAPHQPNLSELAVKTLFATLINEPSLKYEVTFDKDYFLIDAVPIVIAAIKGKLASSTASPDAFMQSLSYTIKELSPPKAVSTSSSIVIPDQAAPGETLPEAMKVLNSLFSAKSFGASATDISVLFDGSKGAKVIDGVLYSKPTSRRSIKRSWQGLMESLIEHFEGKGTGQLRAVWRDAKRHLALPEDDMATTSSQSSALSNHALAQCFGIVDYGTKAQAFINYRRLYQLLFPPQYKVETHPETAGMQRLKIPRAHFMQTLQQLTQDTALFKRAGDKLIPILLGTKHTHQKPNRYVIMLDRSGSMEDYFVDLKKSVKQFLSGLAKNDPSGTVRLVSFDHRTELVGDFSLSELSKIYKAISNIPMDKGATRLVGTVVDTLSSLASLPKEQNNIFILFTDGEDYLGEGSEAKSKNTAPLIKAATDAKSQALLPKFYALGFGQCDHEFLRTVTGLFGCEYRQLDSLYTLNDALVGMGIDSAQRELLKFMLMLEGQSKTFEIPVPQNDMPTVAPAVILPFTDGKASVVINGKQLTVQAPSASPSALTPAEQTLLFLNRFDQLIVNNQSNIKGAVAGLKQLKADIAKSTVPKPTQTYFAEQIDNVIKKAGTGSSTSISELVARSQQRSGILAQQNGSSNNSSKDDAVAVSSCIPH